MSTSIAILLASAIIGSSVVIGFAIRSRKLKEIQRLYLIAEEERAKSERLRSGQTKLVKKKVSKPRIITRLYGRAPERIYCDPLDYEEHVDTWYMSIRNPDGTTETKQITYGEYARRNEGDVYGYMDVIEEVEVPNKKKSTGKRTSKTKQA